MEKKKVKRSVGKVVSSKLLKPKGKVGKVVSSRTLTKEG